MRNRTGILWAEPFLFCRIFLYSFVVQREYAGNARNDLLTQARTVAGQIPKLMENDYNTQAELESMSHAMK